ncbi:hypothetical protein AV530_018839 [Patagioenas fasciata monilis]|uniref:Uncharacterized protein n=1 Tax=Patagioenas fasciata monilis TaxID=372326 RepID=A0A1V4JJP6_PATFA|nr:hypothetical protein AV530_018839 [Patagioenas fasciata monilis]
MEVCGGADTHLQPMEDPTPEQKIRDGTMTHENYWNISVVNPLLVPVVLRSKGRLTRSQPGEEMTTGVPCLPPITEGKAEPQNCR